MRACLRACALLMFWARYTKIYCIYENNTGKFITYMQCVVVTFLTLTQVGKGQVERYLGQITRFIINIGLCVAVVLITCNLF